MHVLYFPLVTDNVTAARPSREAAREVVRDTPGGWRCVLLFRAAGDISEVSLWERTQALLQRLDAAVEEPADTAYLLTQRAVKALRDAGLESPDGFHFALLVTDGRKIHYYLRGFRCLLWGVPMEASPPLRLNVEDRQNVIESRDFPSVQRRDAPQDGPIATEPVVAVVDEVMPEGLLTGFVKNLETHLALAGPVALGRQQSDETLRGQGALWRLWEEISNLAAVDLRRLESKLNQLTGHLEVMGGEERRGVGLWPTIRPYLVPGLLALNLFFLLILVFRSPDPAPAPTPAVAPATETVTAAEPTPAATEPQEPTAPAAATPTAQQPVTPPSAATTAEPEPPTVPVRPAPPPTAREQVARMLVGAAPTERVHFTGTVRRLVDTTVSSYVTGDRDLTADERRRMLDAATQLVTNRHCVGSGPAVTVDGAVGERTLQRMAQCARGGDSALARLLELYRDPRGLRELDRLEAQLARAAQPQ